MTLVLGFAAVNTGNNLLYLIVSALLSFMGISGFFGRRNLQGIDIEAEFPGEVYAKSDFPLKIILRNRKKFFPAFLITVLIDHKKTPFIFADKGSMETRYVTMSIAERGRHEIRNMCICSVFPFNFFVRCKKTEGSLETIVFPAPKKCELAGLAEQGKRVRGEQTSDRLGYEAEIVSLRDYIKGDPLKYIHWKASAKTGELKTKELSSVVGSPAVIDFDAIKMDIEEKISCVTYLVLKLFRKNVPFALRINGKLLRAGLAASSGQSKADKTVMLRELALYDKG